MLKRKTAILLRKPSCYFKTFFFYVKIFWPPIKRIIFLASNLKFLPHQERTLDQMSYSKCHLGQLSVDKKIQQNVIYTIAIKKMIYKPVVNHFFHPPSCDLNWQEKTTSGAKNQKSRQSQNNWYTSCSGYHSYLVLKLSMVILQEEV